MSIFKSKSKNRSGSSGSVRSSNQKRSNSFYNGNSGRSNSVSGAGSDDGSAHHHFKSLLPEKNDTELTYADIIKALDADVESLPPTKTLLSLQYDLDKLQRLNAQNLEECDANLVKIKRLSSAIERENLKRIKLSAASVESKSTTNASASESTATEELLRDTDGSSASSVRIKSEAEIDPNGPPLKVDPIGLQDSSANDSGDSRATSPKEYEKNPKSEFVEAQELPVAVLGLFDEKLAVEQGLPVNGEEFLKKKYAVASYPTNNLKDELPGEIPDIDFTKAKPPNQVQFSTFTSYIEPYFRPFTEEDLVFLQQRVVTLPPPVLPNNPQKSNSAAASAAAADPKKVELSPYIIPKLGPLYTAKWSTEDGPNPGYNLASSPPPVPSMDEMAARGGADSITDTALESESVSCGPLASRLLAALMSESVFDEDTVDTETIKQEDDSKAVGKKENTDNTNDEENENNKKSEIKQEDGAVVDGDDQAQGAGDTAVSNLVDGNWKFTALKTDYESLEERLKREFKYVGILDINLLKREETIRQKFEEAIDVKPESDSAVALGANGLAASTESTTSVDSTGDSLTDNATGTSGKDDFDIDWIKGREDDEICHELRILQSELKRVSFLNRAYKQRLYPLVQEQLAWQEYSQILEDLDKQVDQAYIRRTRSINKPKKKKGAAAAAAAVAAAAAATTPNSPATAAAAATMGLEQPPQRLKALLDKRLKWITKIGPVFRDPREMKGMPRSSVFEGIRYTQRDLALVEEELDEEMQRGTNNNNITNNNSNINGTNGNSSNGNSAIGSNANGHSAGINGNAADDLGYLYRSTSTPSLR
ncbi:hypothetical protein D0Z03_002535 [Geotrichum reessii]|nr:hypothetical protein D0Z03_002535 [Galactomyces reessii]